MREGWEIRRLKEVCQIRPAKKEVKDRLRDDDLVSFVPMDRLEVNTKYFNFDQERPLKTVIKNYTYFKDEDVLLAKITPCFENGKLGIAKGLKNGVGFGSSEFVVYRSSEELYPEFLYYFLSQSSFRDHGKGNMKGAVGHKRIPKQFYEDYLIPLPPLHEQHRIVFILDKTFAAIDKAIANTEQNLKNAQELFNSYLQGRFVRKGDGWANIRLSNIAEVVGGYSFKSGQFQKQGRYQVIRMGNVRPGIIRENVNPVFMEDLEAKVLNRALLRPNDVIITQTGTKNKRDYGFTAIIEKDNYLLNQRIAAIRFSKRYSPKFFLYFSWTSHFKDLYFANETGTVGQGNVGIRAITDAYIPFPDIGIQSEVVEHIEKVRNDVQSIELNYREKLNNLKGLKKSVLQNAFNGELTSSTKIRQ